MEEKMLTINDVPSGVVQQIFSFLNWRDLSAVAMMSQHWHRLSDTQKAIWRKKLKEEKDIEFNPEFFPPGFLDSHPIDLRALYLKIRYIPRTKIFNNSAFSHYKYYVVLCALVGGQTFWDALALHGRPPSFTPSSPITSYYIAGTFAISGDLESLKKFDETSLYEIGILLAGAVKGGSLSIIEWILDQGERGKSYLQECYGWAIEYRQHAVIELLETKYQQLEPVIEGNPWYCLDKAIASDSVPMVCRFLNPARKPPAHFLHLAAQNDAATVFWYGVKSLGLDINQLNPHNDSMPVHCVAEAGHVELFCQIARSPDCCLHLPNPECRKVSDQPAYLKLLKKAARDQSAKIIRVLHREFNADLSIIDLDTGNTLAHECCMNPGLIHVFRYLILYGNINWNHANKDGKTVAQSQTLQDLKNPFFYAQNTRVYYVMHARVMEYLIKAISGDEDANEFRARLLQFHKDHPQDIMACLALAIVFKDDADLCAQYQKAAREINGKRYKECVMIMGRLADYLQNLGTIDTDCLKTRQGPVCSVM